MRKAIGAVFSLIVIQTLACGSDNLGQVAVRDMTSESALAASESALGSGGHVVVGYAWNDYGYGSWSHTFRVVQANDGRVFGTVHVSLAEPPAPGFAGMVLNYTNDITCMEFDAKTNTMWLGGTISKSDNPDWPVGLYVIDYAHDGGRGGAGDTHGDWVPSWWGGREDCHERLGPLFEDPAQKGNVTIF